jgi:choloylglycine hydrolase
MVSRKLDLGKDQQNTFAGDATDQFKIAKPFEFLGPGYIINII